MLCCTMICRHWYGASMHAERLCLGRNHGGNDVTVRACHAVVADTHAVRIYILIIISINWQW